MSVVLLKSDVAAGLGANPPNDENTRIAIIKVL